MVDPATETVDAMPPPEPLKANRRSLMRRLFGRKNKNQTDGGEDVIEHRGKGGKNGRGAAKKVTKKKPETPPAGEDREPEAAKNVVTPKASEDKETEPEAAKTETPMDAPADPPAEKVVPETVSESGTDEENTTSTAEVPAEKEAEDDKKGEEPVEAEKTEDAAETPATEEPKAEEEATEAQVQSGDDSSRDPPSSKATGLFCGCI